MSKVLMNLKGSLKVSVVMNYKGFSPSVIDGYYSAKNIKREFNKGFKNAILHAKYIFFLKRGLKYNYDSNVSFEILDYDINYNGGFYIKRKNINHKYYNVVYDIETDAEIDKEKWTYKEDYDEPIIKFDGSEEQILKEENEDL